MNLSKISLFTLFGIWFSVSHAQTAPAVDHHTHIWSLNASRLVTEPLMERVTLPVDLQELLNKKHQYGGRTNRDTAELSKLYTKDFLFLDTRNPLAPKWSKGSKAIESVKNYYNDPYFPTSYSVTDQGGYIAGYESEPGDTSRFYSNFYYGIVKGTDGKWRISSEIFTMKGPPQVKAITADQLVAEMNIADVKKAAVLSTAFWFGQPNKIIEGNEYENVKKENDWLAEQVSLYPDRLAAFCSFNPLKDYAVQELNRCIASRKFVGLKLHVGNSRIDVLNPEMVEKLQAIFSIANKNRFPIVIHLWTSGKYGREQAEAFLNKILPVAPDITVQIAHMAATGPNYHSDDVFEVYATAAEKKDPRMKNVYVDVAGMVTENIKPENLELVAKRLRQFGLHRVLFASDRSPGFGNEAPAQAWQSFKKLPFTAKEFKIIAENIAPYLKR
jgi:predicted TIM-barrel fold metal-dependent hydrolase